MDRAEIMIRSILFIFPKGWDLKMKVTDFKKLFLQRKEALELKLSSQDHVQLESSDETDLVQNMGLKRMHDALMNRDKDSLHKITVALEKIDQGLFGVCEECGDNVAEKRLIAVPDCRLCISCAEQEELFKRGIL